MTSLHVICGLGLPNQKFSGYAYELEIARKNFFEDLFFWRTLAAVSLASDFFCVLGLEPCVLDSTSVGCNKLSFDRLNMFLDTNKQILVLVG